jgi:transcription initiation factor TFIID TATA-box-binding protein
MPDIDIENIVVSTRVAESLELNKLAEAIPDSKYDPDEIPVFIIHFEKPRAAAMFFSNGKVVITGPRDMNEVDEIIKMIHDRLNAVGVKTFENSDIDVRSMVASTDVKKNLDLQSIANSLENAEYVPERFPGLVYKIDELKAVIFLFPSGRIVCNGTDKEEISAAIDRMTDELSSLGVL